MLFEKCVEKENIYNNGTIENIKDYHEFYYDEKKILKCPNCNNVIFYVKNEMIHKCPLKQNTIYKINEEMIKNKSNKFLCDFNNIDNKCVKHNNELLLYYKDSNYYCSECLRENNLSNYLNLDLITLPNNEINYRNNLIENSEKILNQAKEIFENRNRNKIHKEVFENFYKRNKILINYCKGLLKFNETFKKIII